MSTERADQEYLLSYDELPLTIHTWDNFKAAQETFALACSAYASKHTEAVETDLTKAASLLDTTFHMAADAIAAAETEPEPRKIAICNLILDEDRKRIAMLRALTAQDDFTTIEEYAADWNRQEGCRTDYESENVTAYDVMGVPFEHAENWQEAVETIKKAYSDELEVVVERFLQLATPYETYDIPSARQQLARALGKNALSIGKVGAGVVLGAWLARRMKLI